MYDKNKGTSIDANIMSDFLEYNHVSWDSEYLKKLTQFSDKVTESNARMRNCGPKQLDFADAQTAATPSHAKSNSSEKKDEAGQTNSLNKGRARAELAALYRLIPSIFSLPTSLHVQIALSLNGSLISGATSM